MKPQNKILQISIVKQQINQYATFYVDIVAATNKSMEGKHCECMVCKQVKVFIPICYRGSMSSTNGANVSLDFHTSADISKT